jgi:hypothetical protein
VALTRAKRLLRTGPALGDFLRAAGWDAPGLRLVGTASGSSFRVRFPSPWRDARCGRCGEVAKPLAVRRSAETEASSSRTASLTAPPLVEVVGSNSGWALCNACALPHPCLFGLLQPAAE